MDKVTFVRRVQDDIERRMEIDRDRTERMIGAVFSALSARLTPDEGGQFIAQLPTPLKELWRHEVATRLGRGEKEIVKLSKDQFLAKIQTEGHLALVSEAEFIARCVIHVLKEAISPGEIKDAVDQLPSDLKEWVSAALIRVKRLQRLLPLGGPFLSYVSLPCCLKNVKSHLSDTISCRRI